MTVNDKLDRLAKQNQSLYQTLAAVGARLESSIKLQSAIVSLSGVPTKPYDLPDAADKIVEILADSLYDVDGCSLLLYEPREELLKLVAAKGQADLLGGAVRPYNKDLAFKQGEGIAGRVFAENTPYFWEKDSSEIELLKLSSGLSTPKSLACLPLSLQERPRGVLNISFCAPKPFDYPRKRDLLLLSGVVANIIQTFILKAEVDKTAVSLLVKVTEVEREIAERRRIEQALREAHDRLEERVLARTAGLASAKLRLEEYIDRNKQAEEELRQSEKRYRDLFDNISDIIYTHDLEGRFLTINRAAAEILGYTKNEIIGKSLAEAISPEYKQVFYNDYLAQIKKHGFSNGVGVYLAKDATKRYIEFRSSLVTEQGQKPYIRGSARDITERVLAEREMRNLEEQLQQSQKMQAIGTLAGGVAHDFNNILAGILGNLDLALNKLGPDHECAHYLVTASGAAERARDLTRQLLAFGRKAELLKKNINLTNSIMETVHLLGQTIDRRIHLAADVAPDLDLTAADEGQMNQVIMNLCVNARDAIMTALQEGEQAQAMGSEHAGITIEAQNVTLEENEVRVSSASPGKYVKISVSDTGCGMSDEIQDRIFEPFFTTKPVGKGTGLGLSTVYGIIQQHEGWITVDSEPGRGTVFDIYLPAVSSSEMEVETRDAPAEIPKGDETILLADDEEMIREFASEFLEDLGYQVLLAADGLEALETYEKKQGEIDLVILDMVMPRLTGLEVLKRILNIDPAAKIIISSGNAPPALDDDTQFTPAPAAFISKPYHISEMASAIRQVLDKE